MIPCSAVFTPAVTAANLVTLSRAVLAGGLRDGCDIEAGMDARSQARKARNAAHARQDLDAVTYWTDVLECLGLFVNMAYADPRTYGK